jgi:glycosyltransferase involved in cell wall biosynthesis
LPEPITGQSLACQVFFDGLQTQYRVDLINLSKSGFTQGVSSSSRVFEVLSILTDVLRKRRSADVIYLTVSESLAGNLKDLFIYLLCVGKLRRMVIHLHGGAGMTEIMRGRWPLLRGLNALFVRRLGGVIVLGERHTAIYSGVVDKARLHIVPNFAGDELFTTVDHVDRKFLRPSPLRLLFLSNLLPGKGHEELVTAFLALPGQTRDSLELDFAGGFESERQKTEFLRRIEGVDHVRYHGTVTGDRKRELFHRAHVFCLPTYYPYEGQPISILEAYASGCAVITTDHSGIRDVFRDGVNGLEVQKRSAPDLQRAIEQAVARPEDLHRMASANLRTAIASYKTSDYRHALMTIIDAVAKTR